jgi:hypothetical protein
MYSRNGQTTDLPNKIEQAAQRIIEQLQLHNVSPIRAIANAGFVSSISRQSESTAAHDSPARSWRQPCVSDLLRARKLAILSRKFSVQHPTDKS